MVGLPCGGPGGRGDWHCPEAVIAAALGESPPDDGQYHAHVAILYVVDLGHTPEKVTLPIGCMAELEAASAKLLVLEGGVL